MSSLSSDSEKQPIYKMGSYRLPTKNNNKIFSCLFHIPFIATQKSELLIFRGKFNPLWTKFFFSSFFVT